MLAEERKVAKEAVSLRPRRMLLQRVFPGKIKGGRAAVMTSSGICVAMSPPKATPVAKPAMAVLMVVPSLWRGGSYYVSLCSLGELGVLWCFATSGALP